VRLLGRKRRDSGGTKGRTKAARRRTVLEVGAGARASGTVVAAGDTVVGRVWLLLICLPYLR